MSEKDLNRRHFLGAAAGGLLLTGASTAYSANPPKVETNPEVTDAKVLKDLNDIAESCPMLQNPTADSVQVVWSIKRSGTGFVEWGETKKLGKTARNSRYGLYPYEERFLSARITGLKPNTTYYYRTVSIGMDFARYGKIAIGNEKVYSPIYSFKTPDATGKNASFFVMNDTHENQKTLEFMTKRIVELGADYTVWNGDLLNDTNSADQAVKGIMIPGGLPFGAQKPVLFAAGNHDHRGPWARSLHQLVKPWNEFDPKYGDLPYAWALRNGPIAMIGLDTGEDKPDWHPVWAGLANFDPMRKLQAEWLDETLNKPEFQSAPFVVVFCHIPIFSADPEANPGDILERWASWQRPCSKFWSPVLKKHDVKTVITGHMHRLMPADLPDENRPWTQIHGGGPDLKSNAAYLHGQIKNGKLEINQEMAFDGSRVAQWIIEPRKISK